MPVSCDSVILYNFPLHPLYTLYNIILSMSSIAILSGRYSQARITPYTALPSSRYSPKNITPNTGRQAVQLLPQAADTSPDTIQDLPASQQLPGCENFNKLTRTSHKHIHHQDTQHGQEKIPNSIRIIIIIVFNIR